MQLMQVFSASAANTGKPDPDRVTGQAPSSSTERSARTAPVTTPGWKTLRAKQGLLSD